MGKIKYYKIVRTVEEVYHAYAENKQQAIQNIARDSPGPYAITVIKEKVTLVRESDIARKHGQY